MSLHSFHFLKSKLAVITNSLIASCMYLALEIENRLVCIIRDNGSNFVASLWDAGLPTISCLACTLQLVIHEGALAKPCVVNVLATGRRLVVHLKCSNANLHT